MWTSTVVSEEAAGMVRHVIIFPGPNKLITTGYIISLAGVGDSP